MLFYTKKHKKMSFDPLRFFWTESKYGVNASYLIMDHKIGPKSKTRIERHKLLLELYPELNQETLPVSISYPATLPRTTSPREILREWMTVLTHKTPHLYWKSLETILEIQCALIADHFIYKAMIDGRIKLVLKGSQALRTILKDENRIFAAKIDSTFGPNKDTDASILIDPALEKSMPDIRFIVRNIIYQTFAVIRSNDIGTQMNEIIDYHVANHDIWSFIRPHVRQDIRVFDGIEHDHGIKHSLFISCHEKIDNTVDKFDLIRLMRSYQDVKTRTYFDSEIVDVTIPYPDDIHMEGPYYDLCSTNAVNGYMTAVHMDVFTQTPYNCARATTQDGNEFYNALAAFNAERVEKHLSYKC